MRLPGRRPGQKYFSGNHVCSSWLFLLQELADPTVSGSQWNLDRGEIDGQAGEIETLLGYSTARGKWRNSNTKDGKRRNMCGGRSGWAAIQTPYGGCIRGQKVDRSIENNSLAVDRPNLGNNLPRCVETFRYDAIRLARLRHHGPIDDLNRWRIHGGMVVNHSRHRICRLNAMTPTFNSGMALTHNRTERGRRKNPSHQRNQENDRSCGSSGHLGKLYLRL